jgi:F-box-like
MRLKEGKRIHHCLELTLIVSINLFVSSILSNNTVWLLYAMMFFVPECIRYLQFRYFRHVEKFQTYRPLAQHRLHQKPIIFGTTSFPSELAFKIFEHLNQHELLQTSQVCRSWNDVATPLLWRSPRFYHKLDKQLSDIYYTPLQTMWPTSISLDNPYFLYQSLDATEYHNGYHSQLALAQKPLGQYARHLSFEYRENLVTDNTLNDIAMYCSSLQNLSLAGCRNITDGGLRYLSRGKLRHTLNCIDLSDCVLVTDEGVSLILQRFHRLQKVFFNGCTGLTNTRIKTLIKSSATEHWPSASRSSLQEIYLRHCQHLSGNTIKYFAVTCGPSLQALNLAYSAYIGDKEIRVIAEHCVALRHLSLARRRPSENEIEPGQSRPDASETNSPIAEPTLVDKKDDIVDDSIDYMVKRLPQLQYLDLSNITSITNQSVVSISNYCHNLATLILVGCYMINEDSLSSLSELHQQHGQLVNITLGGTTEFLNDLVNSIEHDDNWHGWTHGSPCSSN